MKMGNKVVKVQKYIITKEEMKAMAKQGKDFNMSFYFCLVTLILNIFLIFDS